MRLWRFLSVFALVLVPLGSHSAPRSEAVGLSALPTVVATVNVGTTPRGVAVDESRNLIYVTNFDDDTGNGVTKINGATNGASSFSGAVAQPLGVAVNSAANRILVGNYNDPSLSIINGTDGNLIVNPGVGTETTAVAFNPLTGKAYVAGLGQGSVYRVNPDNSVKEISLGGHSGQPFWVAVNPNLKRAYVSVKNSDTVAVINTDTDEWDTEFTGNLGGVAGIAVNSSSGDVYVGDDVYGAVTVFDSGGNFKGALDVGQPSGLVGGIAVNPNTGHVFVNRYDTNEVYVFNASEVGGGNWTNPITKIGVGNGPELGIAVNTATGMAYVANMNDNTVSVIDDVQKSIQLSTDTLAYATAQGGSIADRQVTVANARGIPMAWSLSVSYDKGSGWITTNPSSGTTPSTVTVGINTASLAEDTYTARIVVAATGAINTPQNINVTLLVNNNLQKLYLPVVGRAYTGSW